jgi:lipid A ethanolaminephosphotransferase
MSSVLPRLRSHALPTLTRRMAERIQMPWVIGQEALALLLALYFLVTANATFFRLAAGTGAFQGAPGWRLAACLALAITALNTFMLLLVMQRHTAKPVAALLLLANACAAFFMGHYTVYLDPDMLRNLLHTDAKEAGELLTPALLAWVLLFGVVPALALTRISLRTRPLRRAVTVRMATLCATLLIAAAAVLWAFQPLASLMRNHRELRYLITPGNYIVSLVSTLHGERAKGPKASVGLHARVVGRRAHARPRLLVLVVGETVRAANWGLNGYARQTTPQLARIDGLLNFADVTACGSATEVSVPCMFSPYGRHAYDAARVKRSQGLLHVLDHAGIGVLWRDNQTGCKGVCDGLAFESFEHAAVPGACDAAGCMDEAMLDRLGETVARQPGDMVVVLHQLGNHGPAYYKRYPARLERFVPACKSNTLSDCSRAQIVNAYDNAVLQTDDFLARAIHSLSAMPGRDTALLYVSDHGESLGENGLFLHGVPYAIAPKEQVHVPMVLWMSSGFAGARGTDLRCVAARARQPATHDNLFHTVLGLMQVETPERDPAMDLLAPCQRPARRSSTP